MDNQEFFKSLGLTEYESKTISSLIRSKSMSPKQISENSGVPQNKLYLLLKKFISLGILAELPDKKYQLINFKTFVDEKISEKEEQLKKIKKSSKSLKIIEGKEEFSFQLIKGQIATMNKIAELNEISEKEIMGAQRNWKVWGRGLRVMSDSIKRGVKVKILGVINEETKKRASEWKKCGCSIRAYDNKLGEFPLRFTIFDNKIARVTIGKPEIQKSEDYITIITNSKSLISVLRKQFLQMWGECKKF